MDSQFASAPSRLSSAPSWLPLGSLSALSRLFLADGGDGGLVSLGGGRGAALAEVYAVVAQDRVAAQLEAAAEEASEGAHLWLSVQCLILHLLLPRSSPPGLWRHARGCTGRRGVLPPSARLGLAVKRQILITNPCPLGEKDLPTWPRRVPGEGGRGSTASRGGADAPGREKSHTTQREGGVGCTVAHHVQSSSLTADVISEGEDHSSPPSELKRTNTRRRRACPRQMADSCA